MRNNLVGWMVIGAALLATPAFAQVVLPGGAMGGTGTQLPPGMKMTPAQAAMLARQMGMGRSGSHNGPQSGFNPGGQQQTAAQQAYAQQQAAIAAEKAKKEQERRDKIKASIIAQRDKEQAKKGKPPVAAKSSPAGDEKASTDKPSTASEAFNSAR